MDGNQIDSEGTSLQALEPRSPARDLVLELRASLSRTPPEIPSKHFYDPRGSELFERITAEPEYYPTRTETALLREVAPRLVARLGPRTIAEIGSGSGRKTRILVEAMERAGSGDRLVLLDISEPFLERSVLELRREHPRLVVEGIAGDFLRDLDRLGPGGRRLLVFLAGTVGNLDREEARRFLREVGRRTEPDDAFLLGVDLVKDPARLEAAYNDRNGVTAEFNLNILRVVNARFGADFDPQDFAHVAFWSAPEERIEMHLEARRDVDVFVGAAGVRLRLRAGERIRTEISCKYTRRSLEALAFGSGLALVDWFTDPEALFGLALFGRG